MISGWGDWKRFPNVARGENLEAPIGPGLFEVRYASTGALFAFDAVDSVAIALAQLPSRGKRTGLFSRREPALPDLEYRTWATATRTDAKNAAERMIGRRETYLSGAA